VVATPGRDAYPRFTPDGARIVFSSDRSGALQLYSTPVGGGETVRHTFHSEGNRLECLSPDGRRAIVRGLRERHGLRSMRLMEIDLTTVSRERRLFDADAHSPAWSPDGMSLLFCRGGEQLWREGHRGSRASRIWRFDHGTRAFTLEIPGDFEAQSPLWLPDGSGFYFISNQSGSANLWRSEFGAPPAQLTFHEGEGIITPDLSRDGSTLIYRRGNGIFRMRPGNGPNAEEIRFHTTAAGTGTEGITTSIRGCDAADLTESGQLVFAAAGELWWSPQAGAEPVRMTRSAEAEEAPGFYPDGRHLYYLSDDGISANYRRAPVDGGKPADVSELTRGTGSKSGLKPSPDGRRIAWIAGAGDVFTARADGSEPLLVFPCPDKPTFDWSPDGDWLAIAAEDRNANRDILLVRADGTAPPVNLTRHPAFEGSPKWSPDGRWLVFTGKRDATGEAALWRIDFGPGGIRTGVSAASLIRAGDGAERIPTRGIEPTRVIWHPHSSRVWFQSRTPSNANVYSIGIDGEDMRSESSRRGVPVRFTASGELFLRADRIPEIRRGEQAVPFPIDVEIERPRAEVMRLAFRRIWRTLGERFHDPKMNGRDWKAVLDRYEPLAAEARHSRQFDMVVSRMLGELNASHLAFHRKPWPDEQRGAMNEPGTAHTGIVFDDHGTDPAAPLRVARVIPGTPVALVDHAPRPGETVTRIAGMEVRHRTPLHECLRGAEGTSIPITLRAADGKERVVEARGISYRKARALDLRAASEAAAETVARISPRTAYLGIREMSRSALASLELSVHRLSDTHDRMILDLRDNSGGREADRMLSLFTRTPHFHTIPRGGETGYPIDRLRAPSWDKPLVVLCNEISFSNSEIFCHAMRQSGRAPLVGTRTAGGVISAVNVTIPDAGALQVPFRSWFLSATGGNLDLNGAIPDHPVDLGPAEEARGTDPQLLKAIEVVGGIR
jgi:tricorn protease